MRKCEACGYLAFGDVETCKHCGAVFAAAEPATVAATPAVTTAPAPLGAPSAHAAATPPPPPPPPPWARHATTTPAPPGSASPFISPPTVGAPPRQVWAPTPAPPPIPARKSRRKRVAIAVATVLGVLTGLAAIGALHSGSDLPPGTADFVAGRGVQYQPPDQTYTARFPSTPVESPQTFSVSGRTVSLNVADLKTDDYELTTGSVVLPISIPASRVDAALHTVLDDGAAAEHATISKEVSVAVDGAPGLSITAKGPDGYDIDMVAVSSGTRIFIVGAHAKTGTKRLYDALLASFVMF